MELGFTFPELATEQLSVRQGHVRDTELFGLALRNDSRENVANELVSRAIMQHATRVSFVNAHCVNVAARNPAYRHVLQTSDLLLPDGSGMRIAAHLAGEQMGENLNGTDLFPILCERAAAMGVPIYLLGGAPGVAHRAAEAMIARYPGLRVAGTHDGYFHPLEAPAVVDEINRSGAQMLFVGMGVPMQECWLAQHADRLSTPVTLAVGGLFDFYSARIPRAPLALRRIGCEWMWRLAQEPRRLFGRYILGNFAFLARAMAHAAQVRRLTNVPKRMFDVATAALALVFALPLLLAIACAIRLEDGGPALFRQVRIGRNGRPFEMLKFRSMVVDAEARRAALLSRSERDGTCFKMKRDPRITRVGALLRRWSLDELPQIINVLRGDMSIVGPRPALPDEVITYRGRHWQRLAGRPGITCSWQVSGRAHIPFEQQVEMDIAYLERRSFLADLWLIVRTIPAVLTARGAF